jgi:hypothetical protein
MNSPSVVIELALSGLVIGCVYALVAWGFTIVFNATGLVNFAAGELVMMGGVISATLHARYALPPIITVPMTVIGGRRGVRGDGSLFSSEGASPSPHDACDDYDRIGNRSEGGDALPDRQRLSISASIFRIRISPASRN